MIDEAGRAVLDGIDQRDENTGTNGVFIERHIERPPELA